MSFYVYKHIRNDTNQVFYVGKGRNKRAWSKSNRNKYWHSIVNLAGYSVSIIEANLTESDAFSKEIELIAMYKALKQCVANFCPGGQGSTGYKWTEAQKAWFSNKRKGCKSSTKGLKWSDVSRKALSKSKTGTKLSEKHKTAISLASTGIKNGFYGKKHSKKSIEQIRLKNKNTNIGASNPAARKVVDLDTGTIYGTVSAAAASRNIKYITLYRSLVGKTKVDYRLRYVET